MVYARFHDAHTLTQYSTPHCIVRSPQHGLSEAERRGRTEAERVAPRWVTLKFRITLCAARACNRPTARKENLRTCECYRTLPLRATASLGAGSLSARSSVMSNVRAFRASGATLRDTLVSPLPSLVKEPALMRCAPETNQSS